MEANEKKLNELEEMEASEGEFGESESREGLLGDEEATDVAGGIRYTLSDHRVAHMSKTLVRE